jgi:hypothetical protein
MGEARAAGKGGNGSMGEARAAGNGGSGSMGEARAAGKGGSGSIGEARAWPTAKAAKAAPKTKLRNFNEVESMRFGSL